MTRRWTRNAAPLLAVPLLLALCGCGGQDALASLDVFGGALKKANETAALAQLKKYSVAQSLREVEYGEYARDLAELHADMRGERLIEEELWGAWYRAPSPVPFNGYLFSDLAANQGGGRMGGRYRCGLVAYPASPASGQRVLMILVDESTAPEPTGYVSSGNWRMFWADPEEVRGPVTHWPSEHELRTRFHEIRRRTPEEGLHDAQEVMDGYRSGRTVKDPVFGDEISNERGAGR